MSARSPHTRECSTNKDQIWFVSAAGRVDGNQFVWHIWNLGSQLCMSVAGGSTANGALVIQRTCSQGDADQLWVPTPVSSGVWELHPWSAL
ncbi:hypothetical protein GCM10009530_21790 [Microbispora corallina]|uniref:Ricin B lectin domain-containing protein n=1 Tax=Microbispora corallina TaxID=83302 RepID=A0ABQ4G620_9ACTN|nr:RICIN domain-containing protein [Microbispora corallina]GIH42521.1 hypothetical protein Mco01_55210 [Microbispora corallina]